MSDKTSGGDFGFGASNGRPLSLGEFEAVPAASTNGTRLGIRPDKAIGVRFYLPAAASIIFTIARQPPVAAPTAVFTISEADTGPTWVEGLTGDLMIYVTSKSGSPVFRWVFAMGPIL